MAKLEKLLNQEVANLSVLFTKLHHFHWYVTGPNFFALHEKFEALYDEVNELYDELAERLLTIGGSPASTQKEYLALTTLKEAKGKATAKDMVQAVIDDFKLLVAEFKEGIVLAQEVDDEATADLFIGAIASFEKHVWMLEFTLK